NMDRNKTRLDLSDVRYVRIPENEHEGTRTSVIAGDVLISITADIGIISYADDSVPLPAYINQHIALVRFDSESILPKYAALFLAVGNGQKRFKEITDQGAKAGINLRTVRDLPLAIPPSLDEQRAIATALSDVDALLEELDRLIAKKRDLKQATMQQLLTGQTRLPGFEGEWQERRLIELANFYDNLRVPIAESKRDSGTTPYYGANGIQGYINGHTHDGEFVLIAEDGANDLNNYPVLYINGKIWVNNHAHVIQGILGKVKTRYLSYALKTVDFVQILVGGTRAKLNGSEAKSIKIRIPSDTNEQ